MASDSAQNQADSNGDRPRLGTSFGGRISVFGEIDLRLTVHAIKAVKIQTDASSVQVTRTSQRETKESSDF